MCVQVFFRQSKHFHFIYLCLSQSFAFIKDRDLHTKQKYLFNLIFCLYIPGVCSFHLYFPAPAFFLAFYFICLGFLMQREDIVTVPQGTVVILTVNYNNMPNWAKELSAILLPKPVRNCSIELWVETHVGVCVCVHVEYYVNVCACVWVVGWL